MHDAGEGSRGTTDARRAGRLAGAALIFFLLAAPALHAQELEWSRTYGGSGEDGAFGLEPTTDGGTIVTGFTSSAPYSYTNVYLVKTDSAGNAAWTRSFGGPMNDYGACVRELPGQGYIIAGRYEENPQTFDAYLAHTDLSGNVLWQRRYNYADDERAHSVCETPDGGFLLAGQAWVINGPFGSYDFWLDKTDGNGIMQWNRTYAYESEGNDVALSVEPTLDGGFIVGGFTQSTGWDAYVIRIDASGNPIWQRTYSVGGSDECYSIQPLADGTFILTGAGAPGGGDTDALIMRLAANGDVMWTRLYGGPQDDAGESVRQLPGGGFVVTGITASFGGGQWDVYLLRTDSNGDLLWSRTYGGAWDDRGWEVRPLEDNCILVAGWAWSYGAGMGDAYLLKVNDTPAAAVGVSGSSPAGRPIVSVSAWPNPSPGRATIHLELAHMSRAQVAIYDAAGRRVRGLVDEVLAAGRHAFPWDGRNQDGIPVPSGAYFARAQLDNHAEVRQLTVMR